MYGGSVVHASMWLPFKAYRALDRSAKVSRIDAAFGPEVTLCTNVGTRKNVNDSALRIPVWIYKKDSEKHYHCLSFAIVNYHFLMTWCPYRHSSCHGRSTPPWPDSHNRRLIRTFNQQECMHRRNGHSSGDCCSPSFNSSLLCTVIALTERSVQDLRELTCLCLRAVIK